ncbi:MAG: hypothetical protein MUO82_08230, partial [Candidatus Thermoplasmatota archaeon]|nr:hypothetical protein [Candidatus Thermoplasmatota archaeon]
MKKIFALAVSIILMISILIPLASSRIILSDYPSTDLGLYGSSSSPVLISTAEDAIILEKTIKDGENWVNTYYADPGEIIRFRIKATYHDVDGDPDTGGYMLNNITIIDRLPSKLIYLGNSNYDEKSISPDEKYIFWEFKDIVLYDTESVIVEFDSVGYNQGTFVNNVDVTAFEHCDGVYRCNTTHATVIISNSSNSSTHLTKNIDVDDDNNNETAIDVNDDLSDGYEVYKDPDNSSYSIKSIDGDYDGKIDHFIDINIGGIPDKYWDPDYDILTDIQIIDV